MTLATWREAANVTMREAGALFGLSEAGYSLLERGLRYTRGPRASRIHAITGVPVAVLVGATSDDVSRGNELLRRTLPYLIRLGDFIGNGLVPNSMDRCDLIGDITDHLEGGQK